VAPCKLQDDFNYDLLNSASAPSGGADLPAGDMLPTQDASLWQVHIAVAPASLIHTAVNVVVHCHYCCISEELTCSALYAQAFMNSSDVPTSSGGAA
jgi:hypothetical protein